MKHTDIIEGQEYGIQQGRGWDLRNVVRCVVIDAEKSYRNWLGNRRNDPMLFAQGWDDRLMVVKYGEHGGHIPSTARILVEVHMPVSGYLEVNPETGEPWTDEELGWVHPWQRGHQRHKWMVTGEKVVQYAARPAEIRCPWSEIEALRKKEKEETAAQRIINQEIHARLAGEWAVEKAERTLRQEQAAKERAQREEFYDTRLEPLLIELGVEHKKDHYPDGGRIVLSYEAMATLLSKIPMEV